MSTSYDRRRHPRPRLSRAGRGWNRALEPEAGDATGKSRVRPLRKEARACPTQAAASPHFCLSASLLHFPIPDSSSFAHTTNSRKTQPLLTSSICMRISDPAVVEPQNSTYGPMLGIIPVNHHEGPSAEGPSDSSWAASNAREKKKRFQCPHCQRLFARLEHQQRHERTRECSIE